MTEPHASLVWVIVEGVPRHVSEFSQLPSHRRPAALCPECGRRLTLKLGRIRRHHAAHAPGQICAATNPETALHLDCKLALAAALRASIPGRATLTVLQQCPGPGQPRAAGARAAPGPDAGPDEAPRCTEHRQVMWVDGWDDVLVEHRVGDARRPDIVLVRDATPLGALEVVVSNAVSPDKEAALRDMRIPWLEIHAEEWMTSPGAWTPRAPLAVRRSSDVGVWRCAIHAARADADALARQQARDAERAASRHASVLRAARVVDLYHEGGTRERFIYRITEDLVDGVPASLSLRHGTRQLRSSLLAPGGDRRAAWPDLRAAFAEDVDKLARDGHSFADSPMRWARGDAAENLVDEALMDRVGRDPTPLATRYPRRWFYAAERGQWFLPADMRDVRWDRHSPDAFAAHPAWSRVPMAVRERPAPEGSWPTPVFAARPIAAAFSRFSSHDEERVSDSIVIVEVRPSASVVAGSKARSSVRAVRRALAVVERRPAPEEISAAAASLAGDRTDALWISHPLDWCDEFAQVAWAPAGRDASGRGVVVIDGHGVFRAAQVIRALARGDRRLDADAVRASMRARVLRLMRGGTTDPSPL